MSFRPFDLLLRPAANIRRRPHTDPSAEEFWPRLRDTVIAASVIGTLIGILTCFVPASGVILLQTALVGLFVLIFVIFLWLIGL